MNYKEALIEMGYSNISETARDYRTRPIYRESSNNTSLSIDKSTGFFVDYGQNIKGSFNELVKISMGLKTLADATKWISNKYTSSSVEIIKQKPLIRSSKKYSEKLLLNLTKDHSYWLRRGVSEETIKLCGGGVSSQGAMNGRYVFPVFNYMKEIIGFTGRDLVDRENNWRPKWKHIGDKSKWRYPLSVNHKILRDQKQVILIESIGDMLSLWDAGVRNTVVTFGLDLNSNLMSLLIRLDPNKIVISLNNDDNKNSAGNLASSKAHKRLSNHFDLNQIQTHLPSKNDFGEMNSSEIREWQAKIK